MKLIKTDRIKTPLTTEEIEEAEEIWIKKVQAESFGIEINCLKENKNFPKDSKIRELNSFLNERGIVRISGRLHQSTLSYHEKHPILIPVKIRFTELLVKEAHEKVLHSGVADTLIQVREKYWVPKGRQIIKSINRKCFVCKKFNSRPGIQIMAPLPRDRMEQSPPFAVTGLDFAGPKYVKNSKKKFYILLCTCAVTRELHLELVTSLTTEAFLAEIELRRRLWTVITHPDVKEFCASRGIKWKYIIERGAWWGGYYERIVRSVKTILRKIIGKSSLTSEELETVLCEIEAVLNSRPLTYFDSDSTGNFPLTVSHFLLGRRLTSLPAMKLSTVDCVVDKKGLLKRFNYRERLLNNFWRQWRKDYLLNLKSAHFGNPTKETEFKLNDIVLIHDDRLPRSLWKFWTK
ncbi:integrase catalytic domain-containing protein [Trichonephila clavipes]|nr:integrase catalytic domain-containing protein [Trichonephila clavipes]